MDKQVSYIECDIPPGMTCEEYRRQRAAVRRRPVRFARLRRMLRVQH